MKKIALYPVLWVLGLVLFPLYVIGLFLQAAADEIKRTVKQL